MPCRRNQATTREFLYQDEIDDLESDVYSSIFSAVRSLGMSRMILHAWKRQKISYNESCKLFRLRRKHSWNELYNLQLWNYLLDILSTSSISLHEDSGSSHTINVSAITHVLLSASLVITGIISDTRRSKVYDRERHVTLY